MALAAVFVTVLIALAIVGVTLWGAQKGLAYLGRYLRQRLAQR
ncbi:MAG: hypothetical protein HW402_563 [Dehalococcoidales bacterium]|nr:hypothetical protein [Dehalococcoidales bacterium]